MRNLLHTHVCTRIPFFKRSLYTPKSCLQRALRVRCKGVRRYRTMSERTRQCRASVQDASVQKGHSMSQHLDGTTDPDTAAILIALEVSVTAGVHVTGASNSCTYGACMRHGPQAAVRRIAFALARAGIDGNLGAYEGGGGSSDRDAPKKFDVMAVRHSAIAPCQMPHSHAVSLAWQG